MSLNLLVLVALAVTLGTVAVEMQSAYLRLNEPFEIIPLNNKELYSDFGVMTAVRQCGGEGKLLKWRHELCQSIIPGPCVVPAGQHLRGEMTFRPSDYSKSLGIQTSIKDKSGGTDIAVYQNHNVNVKPVEPGQDYAVKAGPAFGSELRNKRITVQLKVYREVDQHLEVCSEADFYIF